MPEFRLSVKNDGVNVHGNPCFGRSWGSSIRGHDHVAEPPQNFVLLCRKKSWPIASQIGRRSVGSRMLMFGQPVCPDYQANAKNFKQVASVHNYTSPRRHFSTSFSLIRQDNATFV